MLLAKNLGQSIFRSFSWGEFFTNIIFRHNQKQVVMALCHVQNIWWIHKKLPTKLLEILASYYRCLWPFVVLMQDNSSPIDQSWLFLDVYFLQTVQWLEVKVWIKSLVVEEQLIVDVYSYYTFNSLELYSYKSAPTYPFSHDSIRWKYVLL